MGLPDELAPICSFSLVWPYTYLILTGCLDKRTDTPEPEEVRSS